MIITEKTWVKYIEDLKKVDDTAAERMARYLSTHAVTTREEINRMLEYAYGLSTKYGEAAAELACEMFDAVAAASGTVIPAAEPAATATMAEVAKTINGVRKRSQNVQEIASAVGRMVKMSAADTTLKNAIRTGAEFAWIPHGDTCAFCIMLASNGWKKASKAALKGGHAEHIHSNCDCQYAVRFNNKTSYGGYDPDKYKEQFDNAEGDTWQEKLNAMRRRYYAENKERINAQKRSAYEKRNISEAISNIKGIDVTNEYQKNATPGQGLFKIEQGFSDVAGEENAAKWIHGTFGGDITLLADSNPEGMPNPDFLWKNRLWDLKTPRTTNGNTIDKRIQHGIWQIDGNPGGVMLDFTKSKIGFAEAIKAADEYGNKRAKHRTDIIVKKDNSFVVIRIEK